VSDEPRVLASGHYTHRPETELFERELAAFLGVPDVVAVAFGGAALHVGFDIGASDVTGSGRVRIVDLPAVPMAAVVHRGTMEDIAAVFDALLTATVPAATSRAR
jgi:dTDP-4-amino-4,6-dideoxygalactose transaminase